MRKFLGVSIVAMLAVTPMMAQANVATVATDDTTVGVASTKYVKEAYNAMAGAVNTELGTINTALNGKQATMSAGKGIDITSNKVSVDAGTGLGFDGTGDTAKLIVTGLTNAQIANGAAIDQSKISNLTTDLGNKVTNAGQFTGSTNSALIKDKTVVGAIQSTAAAVDNINNAGYITKDVNNLTNYTTTTDMNTSLAAKQNLLTNTANAGTAITINDSTHKISVSGVTNSEIASNAAIAQSKIANLTTDLGSKVNNSGNFTGDTDSALIKTKTVVNAIKDTAAAVDNINNAGYITKDVNNLTNYTTTTDMNTALSGKQDKLTAGNGIDMTGNVVQVKADKGLTFDTQSKKLKVDLGSGLVINSTNDKVDVSGITTSNIAANAGIKGTQLAANAGITGSQLATNAGITGSQLAANAGITGSQLATNAAIAKTQLASGVQTSLDKADKVGTVTSLTTTTKTDLVSAINEVNGKVLTIYSGWNSGGTPGTTSTVTLTTPAS